MKATVSFLALLIATAAQAQDAPKAPIQDFGTYGRDSAEGSMTHFARCIVQGAPEKAEAALETKPASPEERAAFVQMAKSRAGCLGRGKLRMKGNWMRGAIAEQLYLYRFKAPIDVPARLDAPAPTTEDGDNVYHAYAGCIVARNAPAVDSLIRVPAGSAQERAAYQDAMPVLSSCLGGGESRRLAIDRTILRGFLAEALFVFRKGMAG